MNGSRKRSRKKSQFLETNGNELTTQNLWNTAKAVLREKFLATQAYLKKIETFQQPNPTSTNTRRTAQSK